MSTNEDNDDVVKGVIALLMISFTLGFMFGSFVSSPPECVSTVTDMATDTKTKERVYSCKRHDQKMTIDIIENGMRVICTCKEKLCSRTTQSCTSRWFLAAWPRFLRLRCRTITSSWRR